MSKGHYQLMMNCFTAFMNTIYTLGEKCTAVV